jgi:hypothetical protein
MRAFLPTEPGPVAQAGTDGKKLMNKKFVLFTDGSEGLIFAKIHRDGLEKTPRRLSATEFDSARSAYEIGGLVFGLVEQKKWRVGQR